MAVALAAQVVKIASFVIRFGLVAKRQRKLKDEVRLLQSIINGINDIIAIKSKLRGCGRKDLLSSISFLEVGVELLQLSLGRLTDVDEEDPRNQKQKIQHAVQLITIGPGVNTFDVGPSCPDEMGLVEAIRKLKSVSPVSFESAKSSFKAAREKATEAFYNEALSTEDRIMATKLQVISAILGCLEDPAAATVICKVYLKELHAMSVIHKATDFVYGRNPREKTTQTCYPEKPTPTCYPEPNDSEIERLQLFVASVALINYVVFHFTEAYTKGKAQGALEPINWPRIKISGHSLHPIQNLTIKGIMKKHETAMYESHHFPFDEPADPIDMAVNSKGEFIVANLDSKKGNSVKVFSSSGEFQFSFSPKSEGMEEVVFDPRAVDTDADDNIYVVTETKSEHDILTSKLFVFDRKGNTKKQIPIECGNCNPRLRRLNLGIALNKENNNIFVSIENHINVYESNGEFLYSIDCSGVKGSVRNITIGDMGEIIVADTVGSVIHIITGEEVRQLEVSEAGGWKYVAFNHISGEIIVSYLSSKLTQFVMESYSKQGKLLGFVLLPEEYSSHPRTITITPNGYIAVLYERVVHLI